MKRHLLALTLVLLTSATSLAQDDNFFYATISGAESILLGEIDINSFDYGIDHRFVFGEVEANDEGNIVVCLPKGEYEYIAYATGKQPQHGTFQIWRRNIYFTVHLRPANGMEQETQSTRQMVHDADLLIWDKKYKEARELYRRAAVDGNAEGMYAFAFMLKNGVGGKKDKEQAFFWLKQALAHGHWMAAERLENFNRKWKWGVSSGYGKATKFIP